jgi:hypothetical protein
MIAGPADDDKHTKLFALIEKVEVTRNWWSHGAGHVTVEECVRAMQAALDILCFMLPTSSISCSEADAVSASVQSHIADVSLACPGANDVHLSMFSQTCLFFMRAMHQLRVAAGGSFDCDIVEAIAALKHKGKLDQTGAFCCEAVLKGRHYMFHGKDTDRVLPLLVSLCSISTLLQWLGAPKKDASVSAENKALAKDASASDKKEASEKDATKSVSAEKKARAKDASASDKKAREKDASACDASVMELMARLGVDDVVLTMQHIVEGHAAM